MLELVTGIVVAVAVVALVIEPLFVRRARPDPAAGPADDLLVFEDPEESASPRVKALLALKEIEFDRATGKISDADYAALKRRYGRAALEAMDSGNGQPAAEVGDDAVERAIADFKDRGPRVCPDCGDRPEPAAVFCSSCGRALGEPHARPRCWECGAELEADARFCGACGFALTA